MRPHQHRSHSPRPRTFTNFGKRTLTGVIVVGVGTFVTDDAEECSAHLWLIVLVIVEILVVAIVVVVILVSPSLWS